MRYKQKAEAFKTAKALEPTAEREKVEGFVLFVGSDPQVVLAGLDREKAIEQAKDVLNEHDTIVFVSKLQSKFGEILVTKDQLILTRKSE